MSFSITESEKTAYELAEQNGMFSDLPDGQGIGFAKGETASGDWTIVFMTLRGLISYEDPDQRILFVEKQGERREFHLWKREAGSENA
jgi:hypothetical protein